MADMLRTTQSTTERRLLKMIRPLFRVRHRCDFRLSVAMRQQATDSLFLNRLATPLYHPRLLPVDP